MDAMKLLGSLMGRNATGGNLLGSLLGGGRGGGGAGGMLGSLLGGGGGAGGMLGSLLGGGGGAAGGGLGSMLGGLLGGGASEPAAAAPALSAPQQADQATLMIRAMCNAAKADGEVDAREQENIIGKLGDDVGQAEMDFLKQELAAPLDVAGFARSVPADLAQSVYALSVMTVKVDTPQEAKYLQQLGQGLNLGNDVLAGIHRQLGVA